MRALFAIFICAHLHAAVLLVPEPTGARLSATTSGLATAPLGLKRLVFEGDSMTDHSTGFSYAPGVTTALAYRVFDKFDSYNQASGGDTLQAMVSEYATQVFPYRPLNAGELCLVSLLAGHNDIHNIGRTALQIEGDFAAYWAAARSDGFKTVAFTIPPSSVFTAGEETIRQAVNTWIVANASLYDFGPVRLDLIPFNDPNDGTIYSDGTHFTALGAKNIADAVSSSITIQGIATTSTNNGMEPVFGPVIVNSGGSTPTSNLGLNIRVDPVGHTAGISYSKFGVVDYPLYIGHNGTPQASFPGLYVGPNGGGEVGIATNSPRTWGVFAVRKGVTGIIPGYSVSGSFSDGLTATASIAFGDSGAALFSDGILRLGASKSPGITFSASTNYANFSAGFGGDIQALSGAGAVDVAHLTTALTTTGEAQSLTLANGTPGQFKTIAHDVDGGSAVLTPTTKTGFSTITFTNSGDTVTLQYFATRGWMIMACHGVTIAP